MIFPVTAFTCGNVFVARNELNFLDVLGVLVAELRLDAEAKRRAIFDGHRSVIQFIGEDRLWMGGVDEIDTFVIVSAVAVGIHAAKHDKFCLGRRLDSVHNLSQPHSFPFADHAPTFDAIVTGDLRAR